MYLVLILCILQCFSQGLTGAFCLGELFSQQLIAGLQTANLTLLGSKSRDHAHNREKEKKVLILEMLSRKSCCLLYLITDLKAFCQAAIAEKDYLHSDRSVFIIKFLCEVMQRLPFCLSASVLVATDRRDSI